MNVLPLKLKKKTGFRELVFSQTEMHIAKAKRHKYEHYAARLAVKEALAKALGTGWLAGTNINEAEVLNDEKGKPYLQFHWATGGTYCNHELLPLFHVSISHTKTMATAIVVVEKNDT